MKLNDVFLLEAVQILGESKASGTMKIRGIFQRADEANANNRIYPKSILENSIKSLQEKLDNRSLLGELDHPTYTEVKLQNASHLITKLEMEGNDMVGEAEILPTQAGRVVQDLIKSGVKVGISSRGTGTLSESANGVKTVNEDFNMVTFDLVADPSTRGAFPSLSESMITENREQVKKSFNKVYGEKLFVNLLTKKLNESKGNVVKSNVSEGSMGVRKTTRAVRALNKKGKLSGTNAQERMRKSYSDSRNRLKSTMDKLGKKKVAADKLSKKGSSGSEMSEGSLGMKRTIRKHNSLIKKKGFKSPDAGKALDRFAHSDEMRNKRLDKKKKLKLEKPEVSEGLKKTQRIVQSVMKGKAPAKAGEKAIKKQMMKDRVRGVVKGNANPGKTMEESKTIVEKLRLRKKT